MKKAEFVENYTGGHYGDVKSLETKLAQLAELVWGSLKYKGTGTAAAVAAVVNPENGDTYQIKTTGGDLNASPDAITTAAGDLVMFNGETGLWEFILDKA